ncbi:MAG TPA: hypothetical protein VFZ73_03645 [Gemmatimonadaceae bacterium]
MIRRLLITSVILAGCGGGSRPETSALPPAEAPLNSFAAVRLIVLPTQRAADRIAWGEKAGEPRVVFATFDSSLESAVRDKGLTSWVMASELARTARRNPTYATNPADIRAGDAVRFLERQRDANIPEPVASQLRTLAGFHDARYALIPAEIRFEAGSAAGTGRIVVRMAVLDVRGSRLVFIGDISGTDAPDYTAGLVAALARRFADLVVP